MCIGEKLVERKVLNKVFPIVRLVHIAEEAIRLIRSAKECNNVTVFVLAECSAGDGVRDIGDASVAVAGNFEQRADDVELSIAEHKGDRIAVLVLEAGL